MKTTNKKPINFIILFAVLLNLTFFQLKTAKAENRIRNDLTEPRIINGEKSQSDAWPWMAAILTTSVQGSIYIRHLWRPTCGSSVGTHCCTLCGSLP